MADSKQNENAKDKSWKPSTVMERYTGPALKAFVVAGTIHALGSIAVTAASEHQISVKLEPEVHNLNLNQRILFGPQKLARFKKMGNDIKSQKDSEECYVTALNNLDGIMLNHKLLLECKDPQRSKKYYDDSLEFYTAMMSKLCLLQANAVKNQLPECDAEIKILKDSIETETDSVLSNMYHISKMPKAREFF